MTEESIQQQDVAYELEVIKLPALTGWKLKSAASISGSEIGKRYILTRILKLLRIPEFREKVLQERSTYFPLQRCMETLIIADQKTSEDVSKLIRPSENMTFHFMTISDYVKGYRNRIFSAVEVAEWVLTSIEKSNHGAMPLRAMTQFHRDEILDMARASKRRWDEGQPISILDGIPIAVKEEIDMKGYATTGGTVYLGKEPAVQDATVVQVLRNAGVLLIGKTNMHEHGLGITNCNPREGLGIARNPYDPTCYPGGSSGGSASAVASGKPLHKLSG
jgi:hypothetical protein